MRDPARGGSPSKLPQNPLHAFAYRLAIHGRRAKCENLRRFGAMQDLA